MSELFNIKDNDKEFFNGFDIFILENPEDEYLTPIFGLSSIVFKKELLKLEPEKEYDLSFNISNLPLDYILKLNLNSKIYCISNNNVLIASDISSITKEQEKVEIKFHCLRWIYNDGIIRRILSDNIYNINALMLEE